MISLGSPEDKIFIILSSLLRSAGIDLVLYNNYDFPKSHIHLLLDDIRSHLVKHRPGGIVFDLRVLGWADARSLEKARNLSQSLQAVSDKLRINSSVFLCNGYKPLGNAIGASYEYIESWEILTSKGPPDLKKYVLEVGVDLLLLTKKYEQKLEAKKFVKDAITQGKAVHNLPASKLKPASEIFPKKYTKILSPRKGYIHYLSMEAIFKAKSKLISSRPGNGMIILKKVGDSTEKGDHLVELFTLENEEIYRIEEEIKRAYIISQKPPNFQPLILERPGLRMTA